MVLLQALQGYFSCSQWALSMFTHMLHQHPTNPFSVQTGPGLLSVAFKNMHTVNGMCVTITSMESISCTSSPPQTVHPSKGNGSIQQHLINSGQSTLIHLWHRTHNKTPPAKCSSMQSFFSIRLGNTSFPTFSIKFIVNMAKSRNLSLQAQ